MTHPTRKMIRTIGKAGKSLLLLIIMSISLGANAHTSTQDTDNKITEEEPPDKYIPEIIKFESPAQLDEIENDGGIILRRRGNLALALLPNPEYEATRSSASKRKGFKRLNNSPVLDVASKHYNANYIHEGVGLERPYTGNGVVVGICDTGFDPSHPAFLSAGGNESRIALITQYKESQGERIELTSYQEMLDWGTDNRDETHATHVAGILTGAYNADGYQGMAPGAEFVMSASELSDVGLLAGVEDIIEYAKSVGKPAVVNISMANCLGPHDGTSLFCQYIDMLGEEAIISLSAGNSGQRKDSFSFTFNDQWKEVELRLANYEWTQFHMYGATEVWSADSSDISYRLCIYDETSYENVYLFPTADFSRGTWTVNSFPDSEYYSEEFSSYYSGEVRVTANLNQDNDRYSVTMEYDATTETLSDAGPWARYNLAIIIGAPTGKSVDVFADGQYTFLKPVPGGQGPTTAFSFSDLGTAFNVLSVGMYNNRDTYPSISQGTINSPHKAGEVCAYSSYATLRDGRVMPITVAPGCVLISAASAPFLQEHPDMVEEMSAKSDYCGENIYWSMNIGTSMSSPYVAGSVATWLEANPNLDIRTVQKIIKATNRQDHPNPEDPRNGQGWFDPYAGLKMAVSGSGITSGKLDTSGHRLVINGRSLELLNPAGATVVITIFTADGRTVDTITTSSNIHTLDMTGYATGIYIVTTSCATESSQTRKISL